MKISVVIPCFNYERFVGSAIQSVLCNDRAPDEIIVVDDGSTDRSADVVRGFQGVRLLSQRNSGMAGAINAGIAASTGDVIALLDADDTADHKRMAWLEEVFTDPEVCLAWHPLRIVTPAGDHRGNIPHAALPSGNIASSIAERGLRHFAVTSGIAVRRESFDLVGPIPEDRFRAYAEAYLVRTLPFVGCVAATEEPLGCYLSHTDSVSRQLSTPDRPTIAATLKRRLDYTDREHELLADSATAAGFELSVARLRALDPMYRHWYRQYVRLVSPDRREAWTLGRRLVLDPPIHRTRSRVLGDARLLATCFLPARAVVSLFIIQGDYELGRGGRLVARSYWGLRKVLRPLWTRLQGRWQ